MDPSSISIYFFPSSHFTFECTKLDTGKNDEVLNESKDNEHGAHENPKDERTDSIRFRDCLRDTVIHIDEHEEDGEEEPESARDNLSADRKADPAGTNHQETRSKVKPDVRFIFPIQNQVET